MILNIVKYYVVVILLNNYFINYVIYKIRV
jgi:hypothetical protein